MWKEKGTITNNKTSLGCETWWWEYHVLGRTMNSTLYPDFFIGDYQSAVESPESWMMEQVSNQKWYIKNDVCYGISESGP